MNSTPTEPIVGHTPGPWTADLAANGMHWLIGPDYVVAECPAGSPEWEANARLIAAAPELYEALAGWLPIAERQLAQVPEEGRDSVAYAFAVERVDKSRAALAKARTS